jgi:hypothetical protein
MLKEVIAQLEELGNGVSPAINKDLVELLKYNLMPIVELETNTYGFYNTKEKHIHVTGLNEKNFFRICDRLIAEDTFKLQNANDILDKVAVLVREVTYNPFESRNFILADKKSKSIEYIVNSIQYSEYHDKLKPIKGDKDIDLMLKSIRLNDETWINNEFVFTEVIFAWQFFHTSKVMAIPCLYGGQGLGKTTLSMAGEYLYARKKGTPKHIETINVAEKAAAQWGDPELFARLITYDDVPADRQIVGELSSKIKSLATRDGIRLVNIKGKGMVESNYFNIAITTNNIDGIPLDRSNGGDRRVYPVHIKAEDWSPDEVGQIKQLEIPISGNRDRYYPIIQKILNHLYYVYQSTKDIKEVNEYLFKRVPSTTFKNEVITGTSSRGKLFPLVVATSKNLDTMITKLSNDFDTSFEFLRDENNADIISIRGNYFLNLKSNGLVELGKALDKREATAISIYNRFFKKDYDFKVGRVANNKTAKCIRFPMRNYQETN